MKKQVLYAMVLMCAMTATASAGLISATNSTSGLFDGSSDTRAVVFTGAELGFGSGTIVDINVSIDFAKADGEDFDPPFPGGTPFYNEIHFTLTGPDANVITLIEEDSWGSGSGFFDGVITFDDEAALVVNSGAAPVAGSFQPTGAGSLSEYYGISALGSWTLFIEDTADLDALRFRSFTVNITTDGADVPEPATLSLIGAGVLGLCGFRRRQVVAA